jgi:hypothetical protein
MPRGDRGTRGARAASDEGLPARAWSVPLAVSEVSEAGRHLDLVADAQTRAAVATLAGLAGLPRLEASFDVTRRGRSGLHVVGRVSATVVQTCVVTLEPLENEVDEDIDIAFVPAAASSFDEHVGEVEVPLEDAPEPLIGGASRRRSWSCRPPARRRRIRSRPWRSSRKGGAANSVSIRPPVASPIDTVWSRHAP